MKLIKISIITLLFFTVNLFSQEIQDSIPRHRSVVEGTLENGLKYFILENKLPEKKAELRLGILSGSLNEREDQLGLAHFTEHMLFNGTKNFPGNKVIDFLELLGMKFGPEINAYTSTEETVYMLTVPTDRASILDSAFMVLSDWAFEATFDSLEIEKERGVVLEEMRMGKGADGRIRDLQFPVLFHNSRFAKRLPIGDEKILKSFPHSALTDYYKEWYKPELMSIVAVGDFKAKDMETLVKKYFGSYSASKNPKKRIVYEVPDHKERLYSIAGDKEITSSNVVIVHKRPVLKANTVTDYKTGIIHQIIGSILSERLFDYSKTANSPLLNGGGYSTTLSYNKGAFVLYATAKENQIDSTFYKLLYEGEKMKRYGFTREELIRAVDNLNASMDNYFREKDNQYSSGIVNALLDQFINDAIYTDIETGYAIYKYITPTITLEEVNKTAAGLLSDSNLVTLISFPEKTGNIAPKQEELEKIFSKIDLMEIPKPISETVDKPLVEVEPKPGKITSEEEIGAYDVKLLRLSNGAKVYLKKSELQKDEVLMYGFSKGGLSKIDDKDLVSANYATSIVEESGLGTFNLTDLYKKLSGKMVSVQTNLTEIYEEINGQSSINDLEDFFRLVYLTFTQPRLDTISTANYMDKLKSYLINEGLSPDNVFYDSVIVGLYSDHPRMKPMSVSRFGQINQKKAFEIFKERFNSASDFTFVLIGNFDEDIIKSLICRYIASQPSVTNEEWLDRGVRYRTDGIEKTIKKGIEDKATVFLAFPGKHEWNRINNIHLTILQKVLDIKLNEVIREELGGSYSISAGVSFNQYPKPQFNNTVYFNCDPKRIDELVTKTESVIDSIKSGFADSTTLQKAKENALKEREDVFQTNGGILNLISSHLMSGSDLKTFSDGNEIIKNINTKDISEIAKKTFKKESQLKFYLVPAK